VTPWCRIFLEKLIVTLVVKKFPAYMEHEGSLHKDSNVQKHKFTRCFVGSGCETWSLTRKEEVFENKVLRRIYGAKKDKVTEIRTT
jgi:hypothetical protein